MAITPAALAALKSAANTSTIALFSLFVAGINSNNANDEITDGIASAKTLIKKSFAEGGETLVVIAEGVNETTTNTVAQGMVGDDSVREAISENLCLIREGVFAHFMNLAFDTAAFYSPDAVPTPTPGAAENANRAIELLNSTGCILDMGP